MNFALAFAGDASTTNLPQLPTLNLFEFSGSEELVDETAAGVVDDALLKIINEPIPSPKPSDPFDQYLFSHCKYAPNLWNLYSQTGKIVVDINDFSLKLYPTNPSHNPSRIDELLQLMSQVADLTNKFRDRRPEVSVVEPVHADSIVHFNEIWRML